jgi:hypothetical protein
VEIAVAVDLRRTIFSKLRSDETLFEGLPSGRSSVGIDDCQIMVYDTDKLKRRREKNSIGLAYVGIV